MNSKEQARKIQGHTDKLVDVFIAIDRAYSLVEPMIFNGTVANTFGSKNRSTGFRIVRQNLFMGVILDLVKIVADSQDTAIPSLANLLRMISDDNLVEHLRNEQIERQDNERDKKETAERFDSRLTKLHEAWSELESSDDMILFKTLRDKYLAHLELRYDAETGAYRMLDIEELGLTWDAPGKVIEQTRAVVDELNLVVRQAGFDWKGFKRQNEGIVQAYWQIDG